MLDYLDFQTETAPKAKNTLKSKLKKFKITSLDIGFIALLLAIGVYYLVKAPVLIAVFLTASVTFFGIWGIIKVVPILEKTFLSKIRPWHVFGVVIAVTALLGVCDTPADAVFMSKLESVMVTIANASSNTAIAAQVPLIFNMIRAIFLLLVVAAAIFAYNQAQQGSDWRPAMFLVGITFAFVLGIDLITNLFA